MLGVEIEVKDGEGNVVATKTADISEGDTSATFDFVTPFATDYEFTGVWTVNGTATFDFDVIALLDAILEAENQVELLNALNAAEIEGLNEDLIEAYETALDAAVAKSEVSSLEDVQAVITKANESATTAEEKATAVNAVVAATNQVNLLKALQDNFARVNADWIAKYAAVDFDSETEGTQGLIQLETITVAGLLAADTTADQFKAIQKVIDDVNTGEILPLVAEAEMSGDADKVSKARTLLNAYKITEDEVNAYDYGLAVLDFETAIIAVLKATTNSSLDTALKNLDAKLKGFQETFADYEGQDGIHNKFVGDEGAESFDLSVVKSALLAKYREALKDTTGDYKDFDKNQAKDIQALIEAVNGAAATSAEETALENINSVDLTTSNAKVLEYLKAVQALDEEATEVVDAYAAAYKVALLQAEGELDAETVEALVVEVNEAQDKVALLTAINTASTATEMSAALLKLEAQVEEATAFTDLSRTAKLEVAQLVIDARNAITGTKKFDDLDAVKSNVFAEGALIENYKALFITINGEELTASTVKDSLVGEGSLIPEINALTGLELSDALDSIVEKVKELQAKDPAEELKTIAEIKAAAGL